jgi:chemotaxis protein methyltransferase CheR
VSVSANDVQFVSTIARKHAALVLDASKQYLITARLDPLARERGFADTPQMLAASRDSEPLQRAVVEALTTNETSFFRDVAPFDALRKDLLPQLIEARKVTRTLTIWSAACSSGQEPYSIAMMLLEHFNATLAGWRIRILATDYTEPVLAKARAGRYKQLEVNRGLPATMLVKYFDRDGAEWVVKPRVRELVEFSQLNLAEPWPQRACDIVFLRNVLIYFDQATKVDILGRMHTTVAPDGALFLGAAETPMNIDARWTRHTSDKATYYRRAR